MFATKRIRRAFTLVEILIVVIIMGVIATIIIGLFNNTTSDAALGALKDNLRGVRSALQIYVAQHGTYPDGTSFEAQMTQYTDASGNISPTATPTHKFGPYILRLPPLPVGANRGKTTVTSTGYADGYGWQYDATSGDFRANCQPTEADNDGNVYQTF
jgi:prepilin-type N-terminal cleavage/methylation domain-containing protein